MFLWAPPLRGSPSLPMFLTLLLITLTLLTPTLAQTKIRDGADPTIFQWTDGLFYSADSSGGGIWVTRSTTVLGLGSPAPEDRKRVWQDTADMGEVWAPQILTDPEDSRTYIYFAAGRGAAHRMHVVSADTPFGEYGNATRLALPDDKWAIDGALFTFEGQRWFVWSGWAGDVDVEQNIYICTMSSPTTATGPRFIISQPREPWEIHSDPGAPLINEGPEPIVDPNGQLHITYSANPSWQAKYCIGDLRLRKGGDPTYVWDWYKSNGCLFGAAQDDMMPGWDATLWIDGPGHHTMQVPAGDVGQSPGGTERIPFAFHGVRKGEEYNWDNRDWWTGSYVWWGSTTYRRANVPGANEDTGFSFKFFE